MNYRNQIDILRLKRKVALEQKAAEMKRLDDAEQRYYDSLEALEYLTSVAETVQRRAHHSISRVVNKCLRFVFDDPYSFSIDFETKRGRTEATLVMKRGELELRDPRREVGVGAIDVASLGCRVASVLLSRPPVQKVLILDEPFKNVRGKQNKTRLRDMLLFLAEEVGFQFILNVDVDAYPEFALGEIVEL